MFNTTLFLAAAKNFWGGRLNRTFFFAHVIIQQNSRQQQCGHLTQTVQTDIFNSLYGGLAKLVIALACHAGDHGFEPRNSRKLTLDFVGCLFYFKTFHPTLTSFLIFGHKKTCRNYLQVAKINPASFNLFFISSSDFSTSSAKSNLRPLSSRFCGRVFRTPMSGQPEEQS